MTLYGPKVLRIVEPRPDAQWSELDIIYMQRELELENFNIQG